MAEAVRRAEAELAAAGTPVDPLQGLGLLDFVPALEPKYSRPDHFASLADLLERAQAGEAIRAVVHGPPQHGKTSLLQDFFAWGLRKDPTRVYGYASYGAKLSNSKSRKARDLAVRAGVKLQTKAVNEWRTAEYGGLVSTSTGGPLAGNRIDVMVIDDPYKNRLEAESAAHRERLQEWFADVVDARVHPGGSIFCFGTRWHPGDLGGWLIAEHGYTYLKFPAITGEPPNEKALAPNLFPVESFARKRRNAYTWSSIYQGDPRPKGKTVFSPPSVYSELPKVFSHGFGVDGAYTDKTSNDFSAVVRLLRARVPDDPLPHFYVAFADRDQVRLPDFRRSLAKLHALYPAAVGWRWYVATSEIGGADMLGEQVLDENGDAMDGAPVHGMIARADKYARAIAVAEAWNDGRVHVPEGAAWLEEFLAEVLAFTGVNDPHDDFVDALAAAFDLLNFDAADQVEVPKPIKHSGVGGEAM